MRRWFQPASWREVRAEIWRLGARHGGRPLEGAIQELRAPGLPMRRAILLRVCIQALQGS